MLVLIPYFLYCLILLWIYGLIPFIFLKQSAPRNPFSSLIIGFGVLGMLSQLFWLGGPINAFCFYTTICGAILAVALNKEFYWKAFKVILKWVQDKSITDKILLILVCIPLLYQSAQAPKINDMGMYYMQSMQWMQQYGLIPGLANLHPALGLGSAWHSLVVLLNPLPIGFNPLWQLNGVLVLSFVLFHAFEWRINKSVYLKTTFIISLPLAFLYLTAPSPDLPLLLICSVLFYWVCFEPVKLHPVILLIICVFLFAAKVPAFVPVGLAVYVFFKERVGFTQKLLYILAGVLLVSILFYKNYLLSGYFLYPFNEPEWVQANWKVPADWNDAYRKGIVSWGISDNMDVNTFSQVPESTFNRLLTWLSRGGYKGWMNVFIFINFMSGLILLLAEGFKKNRKLMPRDLILLASLLIVIIFEWFLLSQYRLLLPTQLILAGVIFSMIYSNIKLSGLNRFVFITESKFPVLFAGILFSMMAFVPFSILSKESRNKMITQSAGFNGHFLIKPYAGFLNEPMDQIWVDSIAIHFYPNCVYCWDCDLPCQSISQRNVLFSNFGYRIKPLGKRIEDGFCLVRDAVR